MSTPESITASRWQVGALIALTAFFLALRFVNIEADFPAGITRSGMLYTDEGWYANAAVRHHLEDRWVLEGDFNPIVNMPIAQLIQASAFSTLGLGLATARTTVAAFSLLLVAGTYALGRRYTEPQTASWIALLLSVSYFLFAYSRLAILEIVMLALVIASLTAASARVGHRLLLALGSGFILATAVLTKSTAIFALPILMYLMSTRGKTPRRKLMLAAASGLSCVAIVAAYNLLASHLYPLDFSYFKEVNLEARLVKNPVRAARNIFGAVKHAHIVAPIVWPAALAGSVLLLIGSRDFRDNVLVRLCLLWLVTWLALLGLVAYHPPRYYLPLVVPATVLFCVALATLCRRLGRRPRAALATVLLTAVVLADGRNVLAYCLEPRFTFVEMAREVKREIQHSEDTGAASIVSDVAPLLIGNFADSISLETGIRSVNSSMGIRDVDWKIERYRPGYYITLGNEPKVEEVLDRHYRRQKISEWNVFGNYHRGRKVTLFKLSPKEPRPNGLASLAQPCICGSSPELAATLS